MRLEFEPQAFADLQHWVATNARVAKKVIKLIENTQRDPFGGIGKPEPLKNELSGWWSKRIDGEHRLVYRVEGDRFIIAQARGTTTTEMKPALRLLLALLVCVQRTGP